MPRGNDPAEMLFEPTGDLVKDYGAYCEVEDRIERDDLLDGIYTEKTEKGDEKIHGMFTKEKKWTNIMVRNLDFCMNKRDLQPLANSIPHCPTLRSVQFTSAGLTEHSYKVLVEAVYRSSSIVSVAVDFNPGPLFKDPAVTKKDKNELSVLLSQYRGGINKQEEAKPEAPTGKKGGGKVDPKKAAAEQQAKEEASAHEKTPIPIPTGYASIAMTGIQILSLRGNGMDDEQVALLAGYLEAPQSEIVTLSLWGNDITSAGCNHLAKALQKNRKLTSLNLGHNQISDEGAAALAKVLLCADVSNEEALKARHRLHPSPAPGELPMYPTFADLANLHLQATGEDKKDTKKKDAKGKKGEGVFTERSKAMFDKDCIRIDDHTVRVPGNTVLWALDLSNNAEITPAVADFFVDAIANSEPTAEKLVQLCNGADPASALSNPSVVGDYCASVALEKVEIQHPGLPEEPMKKLNDALAAHIAAQNEDIEDAAAAAAPPA